MFLKNYKKFLPDGIYDNNRDFHGNIRSFLKDNIDDQWQIDYYIRNTIKKAKIEHFINEALYFVFFLLIMFAAINYLVVDISNAVWSFFSGLIGNLHIFFDLHFIFRFLFVFSFLIFVYNIVEAYLPTKISEDYLDDYHDDLINNIEETEILMNIDILESVRWESMEAELMRNNCIINFRNKLNERLWQN